MIYLDSFTLPSDLTEEIELQETIDGVPSFMSQFTDTTSKYPWDLFYQRKPKQDMFRFSDITIFYGNNGSGKSTLLNLIAQRLEMQRRTLFNSAPAFGYYLRFCKKHLKENDETASLRRGMSMSPIRRGCIICSDDVFNDIIRQREKEIEYENKRAAMRDRFRSIKLGYSNEMSEVMRNGINLETGEGIAEFRDLCSIQRSSLKKSIRRRLEEVINRSNGENAYDFFINSIQPGTLTLLDEPENSLSATWQRELAIFLRGCASYENCQLIISTHSPFLLSIPGAKIYNLDASPISTCKWNELENVRCYYDLFKAHKDLFEI